MYQLRDDTYALYIRRKFFLKKVYSETITINNQ